MFTRPYCAPFYVYMPFIFLDLRDLNSYDPRRIRIVEVMYFDLSIPQAVRYRILSVQGTRHWNCGRRLDHEVLSTPVRYVIHL